MWVTKSAREEVDGRKKIDRHDFKINTRSKQRETERRNWAEPERPILIKGHAGIRWDKE